MDAATALDELVARIDAHDWEGLRSLLHDDFTCRLEHTGETFDRDGWVAFNAGYPGFETMVLTDAVATGDRAVGRCVVTGRGESGEERFAVASFLRVRDGLVVDNVEVWADVVDEAPAERR